MTQSGFVIYGASSSAMTAAFTAADGGENVTIIEPTHRRWYMWGSGLLQTDRESTFLNAPAGSHLRWGALLEACLRFSKIARPDLIPPSDKILLVTNETVHSVFESMMADFAVSKVGKGTIRIVMNAGLEAVTKDPQTNAILSITCGGVTYPGLNFHDATDEGDLAAMAGVMMKRGRESSLGTGDATSGVRPVGSGATSVRAANLATGRRLKGVAARSSKKAGDADGKLMAFNQRLIVTNHANRIKWADLVVPNYDPANYDKEYELAKALGLGREPGSISDNPMDPVGTYPQYDWNNGGLLKIGTNWIRQFLNWFAMSPAQRINYLGEYTVRTAGLLKAICSDPRWAALPPRVEKDGAGTITGTYQIATETAKWGLVPGIFVETAWTGATNVSVNDVRANGSSLYICTRTGRTASQGGPTGKGTEILDGTSTQGAVWRFLRYYVPGMSPHMYVREGRRIVGQTDQQYDDVTAPERNVDEPVTAYGYPHADAHWVDCFAAADGTIAFEGGSGLAGGQEIVAPIMKWGSLKPPRRQCPNLTVSRATAGTKQGWLVSRLEMCYMKFGDVCGRAAAICARRTRNEGKNIYTGDLSYRADLYPALVAANAPITVPGA